MNDLLIQLFGNDTFAQIVLWAGVIVLVATGVTSIFPSLHSNPILNAILKILNVIAGNVGKNKNADAVKK